MTGGREDLLSQVRSLHEMQSDLSSVKGGAEQLNTMVTRSVTSSQPRAHARAAHLPGSRGVWRGRGIETCGRAAGLRRINSEMSTPYKAMQLDLMQLTRIHEASEVLRAVQHLLLLCKKMQGHLEVPAQARARPHPSLRTSRRVRQRARAPRPPTTRRTAASCARACRLSHLAGPRRTLRRWNSTRPPPVRTASVRDAPRRRAAESGHARARRPTQARRETAPHAAPALLAEVLCAEVNFGDIPTLAPKLKWAA